MTNEMLEQLSSILAEKSVRAVARDAALVQEIWNLAFAEAIAEEKRQGLSRWQLFAQGLLAAKTGEDAKAAFNETASQRLLLFWEDGRSAWEARNAFSLDAQTVERIAQLQEETLYLFNDEAGWTYVLPRQSVGPYFFRWEL